MKTLSVIITVYNLENYLNETFECLDKQTRKPDELIIIEDGSSDNSKNICLNYKKNNDYVKLIIQENKGVSDARNVGIKEATGDYIFILDGDDLYSEYLFQKMMEKAEEEQSDIICCRSTRFNNETKEEEIRWTVKKQFIPSKNTFYVDELNGTSCLAFVGWAWDKLFKRDFIVKNNCFFPKLHNSEDLVFTFHALSFSKKISVIDDKLIRHRIRSGSISNSRLNNIDDFYKAICLLKDRLRSSKIVWEREKRGFLNWALHFTIWAIETGMPLNITKKYLKKIRLNFFPELELFNHSKDYFSMAKKEYDMVFNDLDLKCFFRERDPFFSIIIPAYNSEKYIKICINSIINQTYSKFEIILINDGSTDHTLNIMRSFEKKDSRVRVINKLNSGYGDSVNIGIDDALGDYICILESDDFASSNMLLDYKNIIKQYAPDIIKTNFNFFWNIPKRYEFKESFLSNKCNRLVSVLEDYPDAIFTQPAIWSGTYSKIFLNKNSIRLLTTPGASYQDTSFNFKTYILAKKAYFLHKAYVNYRQDNENSSVNSKNKVYFICDEFREIYNWISSNNLLTNRIIGIYIRMLFQAYRWNYNRIDKSFKKRFSC